ncbi:hypothetical protein INT44_004439 [Umbelopsis vinacea]|uniref:Uncharacterized protein n=1 Tax=Umbelopsis vinacea TaxID=44442 RepID=A0A8H7QB76_9FUNG|nr:hypothetical protein INT44_004439 [Umbelopsis vinacea]KAI9284276.1 hypothetical protein BC943DRAFT_326022 [Umbelopsis sp. AD052]
MTDFTLVAPEPLRFSNSQAESLHYAVTCSLSDDDQSYTSSSWSVLSDLAESAGSNDSSETSAYTEFQEIINSSRCAHRDSYQGNLGLITKLVQTLREHVPASPVPRSHNPLPNNATFATLAAAHSKRASSCTPSVLTSALEGYSVGKAF